MPGPRARMTVVDVVYFQSGQEQPSCCESRFYRDVASDEQPYARTLTVTEAWRPLEAGWLDEGPAGMLVIVNHEGTALDRNPTAEEQGAVAARVVEVACLGPEDDAPRIAAPPPAACWLVLPGESLRAHPALPVRRYALRCRGGSARCTVTVVPG